MAGEEKAENIQRQLFRNLSGEITDDELNKIKQELKQKSLGGFKAGEIQRELKTTDDILEKLKRRGLLKIGDYGILRKLFEAIGSQQLLEHIDEAENSLIAIRWPVKGLDPGPSHRDPSPRPMGYDAHGMYSQQPYPGGNPPPYQHGYPPAMSHQDGMMARPPQPVPHAPPRQQYPSYQQGGTAPPQMAHPSHHPQYSYQDGGIGTRQQQTFPQQHAPSLADVQARSGSSFSQSQEDVFLPVQNIPFDNRTEYEPGRGYVLFINNFFTGKSDQRRGAEIDEHNVRQLFKNVLRDFYLMYAKDVSKEELQGYLETLKRTLSSGTYQSFILILGTHGEPQHEKGGPSKDAVLMADGKWMLVEDIVSSFYGDQIPAMKDKPKVFIIQSCRGKEKQRSVSLADTPATVSNPETPDYPPPPAIATRPVNSDVLIAYATSEGTRAWRNEDEGSWFVKDLCDVIAQYYNKEHILDILVRVNSLMVWREATVGRAKQMPCFVCTFTRRFMLAAPPSQ